MIRWRRSAGVAVGFVVHRRIAAGNRARDAGDWAAARDAYAAALARDPGLAHVWLQLGHAEKELGAITPAAIAYARAAALRPRDAEPPLHRGHAAKLAGDPAAAFDHYLDAMARTPALTTLGELGRLMPAAERTERGALVATFRRRLAVGETPRPDAETEADLFFDVSDLVAYFGHGRLPTGIQRVQIEAVAGAIAGDDRTVAVASFVGGTDGWARLPAAAFIDLARLAVAGGETEDPAWLAALARLYAALAEAPPLDFPYRACLVNLGTSWGLPNYFLHLREARRRRAIRYVPMIYDLIPLIEPGWFPPALVRDFGEWAEGVFAHADGFLAGSLATRADLIARAAKAGVSLAPERVTAVPLDGDFRKAGSPDPGLLDRLGLAPGGFVLFVATLEPRKGHVTAFAAWSALLDDLGPAAVPKLVCVGGKGWLNDAIHARLAGDRRLRSHVLLLSGIGDADLALLYRACRFTLYPSLYEGWGLPVTEALSWGKVPIVSRVASLPEAGGELAVYVPPGDAGALAGAAARLIRDDGRLAEREALIAATFRPRSWAEVAGAIAAAARELAAGAIPSPARPLVADTIHGFGRERAAGTLSGEALRAGLGWAAPDVALCRTRAAGGALALTLPDDGAWEVTMTLAGLPDVSCGWRLAADGAAADGVLAAGATASATLIVAGPAVLLTLAGDTSATLPRADRMPPDAGVSVGVTAVSVSRPRGR